MASNQNNGSRVTSILGGYGRTGRVLRTTFPSKIAQLLSIRRGDRIRWQLLEPGHTLSSRAVVITFDGHHAPASRRTANFGPQTTRRPQLGHTESNDPYDEIVEEFYRGLVG